MRIPDELWSQADKQAGVVSYAQSAAAGMTRDQRRHLVASGRWQCTRPRTLVTHSGPVSQESSTWAALLYAASDAVVSHSTAGALYGWPSRDADEHITIPRGRRVRPQDGLAIHQADLGPDDIKFVASLPVTSPERTVLDLLGSATNVVDALAIAARAVQTRRTTAKRLSERLAQHVTLRWRAQVLEALADVAAGSHSGLELAFARLLRRHGLPIGARQAQFDDGGRRTHADMAFGEAVVIELDGRLGHDSALDTWRDMDRDNASMLAGRRVLRYGWADVHRRPCEVAAQVATVIGHSLARCGPRCAAPLPQLRA